jgi:hypothetical protein
MYVLATRQISVHFLKKPNPIEPFSVYFNLAWQPLEAIIFPGKDYTETQSEETSVSKTQGKKCAVNAMYKHLQVISTCGFQNTQLFHCIKLQKRG